MENLLDERVLSLFLFFVVPGVVARVVYDLQIPSERRNFADDAVGLVSFGVIHFALFYWVFELLAAGPLSGSRLATQAVLLAAIVVVPAVEAICVARLLKLRTLRGLTLHPTPKPWDFYFGRGEPCWVILRMKEGPPIAGYFGVNSFASSFPHPEQLYIEDLWHIDSEGRFLAKIPQTKGAIISLAECGAIEFFQVA